MHWKMFNIFNCHKKLKETWDSLIHFFLNIVALEYVWQNHRCHVIHTPSNEQSAEAEQEKERLFIPVLLDHIAPWEQWTECMKRTFQRNVKKTISQQRKTPKGNTALWAPMSNVMKQQQHLKFLNFLMYRYSVWRLTQCKQPWRNYNR